MTAPLRDEAGAEALPPGIDPESAVRPELSDLERLRGRGRARTVLAVMGPAFVACIAYIDPGNFASPSIIALNSESSAPGVTKDGRTAKR